MLSDEQIKLQALKTFPFCICEIQRSGHKNGSFLRLERSDFGSVRHDGGSSGGQWLRRGNKAQLRAQVHVSGASSPQTSLASVSLPVR